MTDLHTPADLTAPLEPLTRTFKIGRFTVHAIQAGMVRLDGGAMFGVVPKPLWERRIGADAKNTIPLGMRCLLIEHDIGLVLIDNGAGNKEDPKFHKIYACENAGVAVPGRTRLEDGLAALGHTTADIALMIDSHLHFDHAGGNTFRDADGVIKPTFPNARYVVQRGEYEWATHTNERTAASYFDHNYVPVKEAGKYDFVDGEKEVVKGITLMPTPGHTPHHASILIDGGDERALFLADLSPTTAHIPLPWIMGYDTEPLRTLETKRKVWERAAKEDWTLLFEHDAVTPWGRVRAEGKGYVFLG